MKNKINDKLIPISRRLHNEKAPSIRKEIKDYPLFLSIEDVMELTRRSKNSCYELLKIKDCPARKPGESSKYIIPRDAFFAWLIQAFVA